MARQERHKCPKCSRWFKAEASRDQHVEDLHVQGRVPCPVCGTRFSSEGRRDQHIIRKHKLADIPGVGQEGARAALDAFDDLPDGAYSAVAEELGVDWDER